MSQLAGADQRRWISGLRYASVWNDWKGFGDERKSALTYDEQKTMMTLWCIFQSPLMLGAELTKLDEETLSLLCNQKVLALFELPAGQAKEIIRDDTVIVWKTGDYAAIFNVSGFDCMVNISELLEIQEKGICK